MTEFNYLTDQGVIVPDTATTRAEVEQMHRSAWGSDVLLEPETPLGKVAVTDALILDSAARATAEAANMLNPDLARGTALDALGAMLRIYRRAATPSIIQTVVLSGVPNTVIAAGSLCVDANGVRWAIDGARVIGSGGSVTVTAICTVTGPVECAIGDLSEIAPESVVPGWETVTNTVAASSGLSEETAAAFRRRRRRMLAINSAGSLSAIDAALFSIPAVRSLSRRENVSSSAAVIDGISMAPHSIWYCVDGGTDSEVAYAIMSKKDPGAGFNGAVSVPVTDPNSGQIYTVLFDRPTVINVWVRYTVAPVALDADGICKDATMAYAEGDLEGELGFEIGTSVSPFELAGAVNQVEPRIMVRKVEISTDGITYSSSELSIAINELPAIDRSRITVVTQ